MGNRLAHLDVIERLYPVVDTEIKDVCGWDWIEFEVRVGLNGCEVARCGVFDAINSACLQFVPAGSGFLVPLDNYILDFGCCTPIVFIGNQIDFVAMIPLHQLIGTCADGVAQQFITTTARLLELSELVNIEC